MRTFSVRLLIAALACLLLAPAAQAHHAAFYKALFEAIDDGDLEAVRKLFSDQAWTNSDNKSAASGAALHARLKVSARTRPLGGTCVRSVASGPLLVNKCPP